MTSAVIVEPLTPTTRGLLCCSAVAGPLFVTVFVLEGARRPDYKPLRHPVSSLALGSRGWVQVTNFAVAGTLYLAGATGLLRARDPIPGLRLGPALFAGVGLGLLGAAAFRTDPVSGYPPGTPDAPSHPTATGAMHNIAGLAIFLGIPAAALASAWRFHQAGRRGWGRYSAATGVSTLIGTALFGAGFSQASPRLTDCAGLAQRVTIATGFGWLTALSAQALRRSSRPSRRSAT
jgi:Protein of unknown function (DUF998)